jgi:HEAT repeat protein
MTLAFLLFVLGTPTMQPNRVKPPPPAQAGPVTPAQLTPEELHDQIKMYLGTIEKPVTPAMWQRLGPAALPELEKIARDPQQFPTRRAGALNGIAAIGSLTAPDLMLDLAKDEKQPTVVRMAAINGAARVVPKERLTPELEPLMENATNGNIRRAAAEVLAANGGCAAVRTQAKREQHQERMARALKTCNEKQ